MPPIKTAVTDTRNRSRSKAEEEAEAIRARIALKVEHIARETRAMYQQRLEKCAQPLHGLHGEGPMRFAAPAADPMLIVLRPTPSRRATGC
jgi:hypothetical protein